MLNYLGSITTVVSSGSGLLGAEKLRLGDLQLRIMQVLWECGSATVAEVQARLEEQKHSPLAYTTVATMLRKMEGRSLVRHSRDGRQFVYEAAVCEDAITQSMAGDIVDRLFEGSVSGIVHHLLSTREIDRAELDALEKLIAAQRNKQ